MSTNTHETRFLNELNMPIPESPDVEDYQIYSRTEILSLLREVIDTHVLLTIYFDGGSRFIVTNLLAINPEFEEIVFDCGTDPDVNRAVTRSGRFTIVMFLNHVKLQMSSSHMELTLFEGSPALRMRLPESLLRFQRREYFRSTVFGRPLTCYMPATTPEHQAISARVINIGCGGVAISAAPDEQFQTGTVFRDCRIEFPDIGTVVTSLKVCNVAATGLASSPGTRIRCGCRFVGLPGQTVNQIQRFVNILERSRLTR